jgi:hypothetical protein
MKWLIGVVIGAEEFGLLRLFRMGKGNQKLRTEIVSSLLTNVISSSCQVHPTFDILCCVWLGIGDQYMKSIS